MCGIMASVNSSLNSPMLLVHRGPDQVYQSRFKNTQIDFYRLSVTGGPDGEIPVVSESGRWNVFLNGEIYNYRKLIEKYSLPFSDSDTRTIANGIELNGLEFIKELRGMFACVIYDEIDKRTYVFRDVLGEKPLYYAREDGGIYFASEFSALHRLLYKEVEANPQAVACFFRFGYIEEPLTLDLRIQHIPKGVLFEINEDNCLIDVFDLHESIINEVRDLTFNSLLDIVTTEVLTCQINSTLFLSSGVDSRYLLKRKLDNAGSVIALSYKNSKITIDESRNASLYANLLGVKHVSVSAERNNIVNLMVNLVKKMDSPIADPSSLAYSLLFRKTHELGTKVAFTGHGVDELFWGYEWFNEHVAKFENGKSLEQIFWDTPAMSRDLVELIEPYEPKNRFSSRDPYLADSNKWKRARAEIVHSYLNCNGFAQLDRLGMRESVEPRVPFSDSRLYFWSQVNGKNGTDFSNKHEFFGAVRRFPRTLIKRKYRKRGFQTQFLEYLTSASEEKIVKEANRVFERNNLDLKKPLTSSSSNPNDLYKLFVLTNSLEGLIHENYEG